MKNSGIPVDRLPPKLQEQIARELTPARNIEDMARAQAGDCAGATGVSEAARAKPRGRMIAQSHEGPNDTERAFMAYLQSRGGHTSLEFEPMKLRLANGLLFTPDVGGWNTDLGVYELFDVKGHLEDDAAVKVKAAADRFPFFRIWIAWKIRKKGGGGWGLQEVQPWPPRAQAK